MFCRAYRQQTMSLDLVHAARLRYTSPCAMALNVSTLDSGLAGLVVTIYTPALRQFFDFTDVDTGQWATVIVA